MKVFSFLAMSVLTLGLLSIMETSYADPPLPTPVGRVVWIKGDSLKAIMENKEERLLQKQSVVNLHDILITSDNTTAEIVFTDNTLITFQPNTKFIIDNYKYSLKEKNHSVGKSVMSLVEGGFRTITGLIAKHNPNDYQVQTPIATLVERGTDYATYIKDGQLYVAYYKGIPCIKPKHNSKVLCLNANNQYAKLIDANSSPEVLTQEPDGFKQQLEITPAKIGLFTSPNGTYQPSGGPITSFCIQ